jgi:hypothetical protein
MKPIIVVLCIAFLLSCKKEEIQKVVLIKYELTDDVSPVKVKLSVEGDFLWSEWMFDEDNPYYPNGNNNGRSEYVFQNEGTRIVQFSASDKDNEKYFGQIAIKIPKVATKILLTGLSTKSLSANFPDINGEYKIEFILNDPFPTVFKSMIVNLKDREGEAVMFKQPVLFDIPRFYDNTEHNVLISISKPNEPISFFKSNFYLKFAYLNDRLNLGKIQIGYNEKAMFLEADWKP